MASFGVSRNFFGNNATGNTANFTDIDAEELDAETIDTQVVDFGISGVIDLTEGGNILLGDDGNIQGGTITEVRQITLASGGSIVLDSAGGTIDLGDSGTIVGGSITVNNTTVLDLNIESGGSIVFSDGGGLLDLGQSGLLVAPEIDVTNVNLLSGGVVDLGDSGSVVGGVVDVEEVIATTIIIESGGSLVVEEGSSIVIGESGTISLQSGGSIEGGCLTDIEKITITSGGSITLNSGGGLIDLGDSGVMEGGTITTNSLNLGGATSSGILVSDDNIIMREHTFDIGIAAGTIFSMPSVDINMSGAEVYNSLFLGCSLSGTTGTVTISGVGAVITGSIIGVENPPGGSGTVRLGGVVECSILETTTQGNDVDVNGNLQRSVALLDGPASTSSLTNTVLLGSNLTVSSLVRSFVAGDTTTFSQTISDSLCVGRNHNVGNTIANCVILGDAVATTGAGVIQNSVVGGLTQSVNDFRNGIMAGMGVQTGTGCSECLAVGQDIFFQGNSGTDNVACVGLGQRVTFLDTRVGAFGFGDASGGAFINPPSNSFTVRASGGSMIFSDAALGNGVNLISGQNSWAGISDESQKKDITEVDAADVLSKLRQVKIITYKSKCEDLPNCPSSPKNLGYSANDLNQQFAPTYFDKVEMHTGIDYDAADPLEADRLTVNAVNSTHVSAINSAAIKALADKMDLAQEPAPVLTTSDLTLTASHKTVLANGSSNTVTLSLPDASANEGRLYRLKAINITNAVTVDTAGGNIDGAATFSFTSQYEIINVQAVSGDWWLI